MQLPFTKNTRQKTVVGLVNFLLLGLFGLALGELRRGFSSSHPQLAILIALALILIVGINLLLNINTKIEDMARPVKTTLLEAKETYERAAEATLSARWEILAVHNWALDYQPTQNADPSRERYFNTLFEAAVKGKLRYKRIVQLPLSADAKKRTTNKLLFEHLKKCAAAAKESGYKIQVRRCEPLYLVSFLLIDGEKVFVQLDNRDEKTGRYEFNKCIVIEDNTGDVFSVFQAMFDELEGRSTPVDPEELTKLVSVEDPAAAAAKPNN